MATISERLELLVDAKTGGAVSQIKNLNSAVAQTGVEQSKATGITGRMEAGLQKLGVSGAAAGTVLKAGLAAGATAAGYAMVRFASDAVNSTVELASGIRLVQQATGATADVSSRFVAVLDDYGISAESGAKSLSKLAINVAGSSEKLAAHGIEVAKNKDGTVDLEKTVSNIAEAYKNETDASQQAKLVLDAFGKSGRELIPILEQGRSGIAELFAAVPEEQLFSQEQLDDARNYELAIDNLQDVSQELKVELGQALVPVLADVADGLATVTRGAIDSAKAIDDITGVDPIAALGKSLTAGFAIASKVGDAFGFGKGQADAFSAAQDNLAEKTERLTALAADGKKGTEEYTTAQREVTEASKVMSTVQERVVKAFDGTAASAKDVAAETENVTAKQWAALDSSNALANAQLGLRGANLNVESATAAYAKAVADSGAESLDAREAQLRLESSVLAAAAAASEADKKQREMAGGTQTAADATNAQLWQLGLLRGQFPELAHLIDGHIWRLTHIPSRVSTTLELKAEIAKLNFDFYQAVGFSKGGYVPGSGNRDSVPALLTPGEFVVSKDMMRRGEMMPGAAMYGGGDSGGTGTLVIPVQIDGRTVTEVVVSNLNRAGGPKVSQRAITN